jgi:hypothetical protein
MEVHQAYHVTRLPLPVVYPTVVNITVTSVALANVPVMHKVVVFYKSPQFGSYSPLKVVP